MKDTTEDTTPIEKYVTAAESLYQRAIKDAWNADGAPGIVYTTDWQGNPVVHDRMHWTLAEAINTSAVLWHVTHKQQLALMTMQCFSVIWMNRYWIMSTALGITSSMLPEMF